MNTDEHRFSAVQTQNPNADYADWADSFTKNIRKISAISEIRDKREARKEEKTAGGKDWDKKTRQVRGISSDLP
jgi:hypothetical protein